MSEFLNPSAPIRPEELENYNLDRSVVYPVMVRGMMVKNGSSWGYWDGTPVTGFTLPEYDYIDCTWTSGNMTGVVYKVNGVSGTTVGTLAITYDTDGNLLTVTKT